MEERAILVVAWGALVALWRAALGRAVRVVVHRAVCASCGLLGAWRATRDAAAAWAIVAGWVEVSAERWACVSCAEELARRVPRDVRAVAWEFGAEGVCLRCGAAVVLGSRYCDPECDANAALTFGWCDDCHKQPENAGELRRVCVNGGDGNVAHYRWICEPCRGVRCVVRCGVCGRFRDGRDGCVCDPSQRPASNAGGRHV